jgi:phospholipid/cholesterol/gamma-HCH transport system ATP-binding protein
MIEVNNISKSFKDKQVLKDVSANFHPGQTSLIIGASGSGKTVFMKCMVGLHEVDAGHILYSKRDFSVLSFSERKETVKRSGWYFREEHCSIRPMWRRMLCSL